LGAGFHGKLSKAASKCNVKPCVHACIPMYPPSQPFHIEHIPRCRRWDQSNIIASPILNGSTFVVVASVSPIAAFARSRNVQVLIACVAIGIVLSETAVRSLSREGERPPPSALVERVPPPPIKTASVSLQASSRDGTATNQPRGESSCKSFEFSFLNPGCSGRRNHHAARTKHRVATFIMGDSDASQSSRAGHTPHTPFAANAEGTAAKNIAVVERRQNRGIDARRLGVGKARYGALKKISPTATRLE